MIHRDLKPANLLIGGVHASKSSISQVRCADCLTDTLHSFALRALPCLLKEMCRWSVGSLEG